MRRPFIMFSTHPPSCFHSPIRLFVTFSTILLKAETETETGTETNACLVKDPHTKAVRDNKFKMKQVGVH